MKHCPRDNAILASNDVDGYRYFSCFECGGYFIPGSVLLKTVHSDRISEFVVKDSQGLAATLSCANCNSNMRALLIEGCEIDICPLCNAIWLDKNEILRIATYFKEDTAFLLAEQLDNNSKADVSGPMIVMHAVELILALAR